MHVFLFSFALAIYFLKALVNGGHYPVNLT